MSRIRKSLLHIESNNELGYAISFGKVGVPSMIDCYIRSYCRAWCENRCNAKLIAEPREIPFCYRPVSGGPVSPLTLKVSPFFNRGYIGSNSLDWGDFKNIKYIYRGRYKTKIRQFKSGANRDSDKGKLDYEGFYSPLVKKRFAEYMNANRKLKDGTTRDSDNWQKGIPKDAYIKSLNRHFEDLHLAHRGYPDEARENIEDALCAIIFNAQGYLLEILKEKRIRKDPTHIIHTFIDGVCACGLRQKQQ